MGVGWPDISFMLAARELGVSYETTLMIGRQWLFADAAKVAHAYEDAGQDIDPGTAERLVRDGGGFAEPIFRELGAREVDSLDASEYEGSSFVQDLNDPLQDRLRGRYSMVFDGGSLEHVFNFPQALKNCLQAVTPGGHFMTITTANSFLGHGFYQFSPELYYRAFTPENGFEVVAMLMRSGHRWARWFAVADPFTEGRRVTLASPWPTYMYVLGKRAADVEPFTTWPQQSDYQTVWSGQRLAGPQGVGARVLSRMPDPVQRGTEALLTATSLTGRRSGPGHFQRVEMADVAHGSLSRASSPG
jgi:hypothetical protein